MVEPFIIEQDALYDDGALRHAVGLTEATLATARRRGALRFSRQGKRILYRGSWVLAWLESTSSNPTACIRQEADLGVANA